jgi:hypothetical protein
MEFCAFGTAKSVRTREYTEASYRGVTNREGRKGVRGSSKIFLAIPFFISPLWKYLPETNSISELKVVAHMPLYNDICRIVVRILHSIYPNLQEESSVCFLQIKSD